MIKKLIYKLVVVWTYVRCWLKYKTPYGKAKLFMAYKKYTETTMYRDRLVVLGEEFAFKTFVDSPGERGHFFSKLTRKDKVKAFFTPYNYINPEMLNRYM